jgi:hypothetical protein
VNIEDPVALLSLINSCEWILLDAALMDYTTVTVDIIFKYKQFEDKVCKGHLLKTAIYWFLFIEHARLLFMILYSVKVNNFNLKT